MEKKERKAFWIGLGSVLAIIFLLIGFLSLAFSTNGSQQAKTGQSESQTQKQDSPKEEEPAAEEPSEQANQEQEAVSEESEPSDQTGTVHEVESGDTFYSIGLEYDVDWQRIVEVNDLDEDAVLQPGQELLIPNE